jgi:hypothetical protein
MQLESNKTCVICNQEFVCRAGQIEQCACQSLQLHPKTKTFIQKLTNDCVCVNCLQELNDLADLAQTYHFPRNGDAFIENIHYYIDNGRWVFKPLYHYLRGTCCKSGCRHCMYGNRPKMK